MGRFDGYLFVSDFDGTLTDENHRVSEENIRAAGEFISEGGIFTVATGRAYSSYYKIKGNVPINAPAILANGAQTYDFDTAEMVSSVPLPDCAQEILICLMDRFPSAAMEVYTFDSVFAFRPNEITYDHLEVAGVVPQAAPLSEITRPWYKALFAGMPEELRLIKDYIAENFASELGVTFSSEYLLEVLAPGAAKGAAVERLARRLGIAPGRVCCAGDNDNDTDMLRLAAYSFAPRGCSPAVAEVPGIVICGGAGTVSDAISRLSEIIRRQEDTVGFFK